MVVFLYQSFPKTRRDLRNRVTRDNRRSSWSLPLLHGSRKAVKSLGNISHRNRIHSPLSLNMSVVGELVAPPAARCRAEQPHTGNAKKIRRVNMARVNTEKQIASPKHRKAPLQGQFDAHHPIGGQLVCNPILAVNDHGSELGKFTKKVTEHAYKVFRFPAFFGLRVGVDK